MLLYLVYYLVLNNNCRNDPNCRAVPDEVITRLFSAFAGLKQKILFKFDSKKVRN